MKKPTGKEAWFTRKREAHRLSRLGITFSTGSRSTDPEAAALAAARPELLRLFSRGVPSTKRWLRSSAVLKVPKVFSLIDNPVDTLQFFHTVAAAISSPRPHKFIFDHSNCVEVGLSAESILGCIADCVRSKKGRPKGIYPSNQACRNLVMAAGTPRMLGIPLAQYEHQLVSAGIVRTMRARNVRSPRFENPKNRDAKGRAVEQFLGYLNDCLRDHGQVLTALGEQALTEYVGEIVENAEQHAGMVDWTLTGYLDNSNGVHMCEIAAYNFGGTIAGSFSSPNASAEALKLLMPIIYRHRDSKQYDSQWNEQALLTVLALQQHVSSKSEPGKPRGTGTIDLINFFESVSCSLLGTNSTPRAIMTLISGSIQIVFDGTYQLSNVSPLGNPRIIAFNPDNDLLSKPDPAAVKVMKDVFFPGTVYTIKFPLSDDLLKSHRGRVSN